SILLQPAGRARRPVTRRVLRGGPARPGQRGPRPAEDATRGRGPDPAGRRSGMKNLGRKFATMTDEERRRFEQEQGSAAAGEENEAAADELELDDPRDEDHMGRHYADPNAEMADPDARDGDAAILDDAAHRRAVDAQQQGRRRGR